jgi:hypothetical protein
MSQLILTPEEDKVVADALMAKAAQYLTMFGSTDIALEVLIAKVQSQLPTETLVVKEAPAEETVAEAIEEVFKKPTVKKIKV